MKDTSIHIAHCSSWRSLPYKNIPTKLISLWLIGIQLNSLKCVLCHSCHLKASLTRRKHLSSLQWFKGTGFLSLHYIYPRENNGKTRLSKRRCPTAAHGLGATAEDSHSPSGSSPAFPSEGPKHVSTRCGLCPHHDSSPSCIPQQGLWIPSAWVDPGLTWKRLLAPQNNPGMGRAQQGVLGTETLRGKQKPASPLAWQKASNAKSFHIYRLMLFMGLTNCFTERVRINSGFINL